MPKVSRGPVQQIILRIPLTQYAELVSLVPELVGDSGYTRYGGHQRYFMSLINQDLERRRALLRGLQPTPLDGGTIAPAMSTDKGVNNA